MSRKRILPAENLDHFERLGLTEEEKQLYVATLESGLVSVGELQQITEIRDLALILESIRDLTDFGLIRKAEGKMPRYFATLPFIRQALSVEREFRLGLETISSSLKGLKESSTSNKSTLLNNKFPQLLDKLLEEYYTLIIKPFLDELGKYKSKIEDGLGDYVGEIETQIKSMNEGIESIIAPFKNFTELSSQKFNHTLLEKGDALENYTIERRANRMKILKNIHGVLAGKLEEFGNLSSEVDTGYNNLIDSIEKAIGNTGKDVSQLNSAIGYVTESATNLHDVKSQVKSDISTLLNQLNTTHEDGSTVIDAPSIIAKLEEINTKIESLSFEEKSVSMVLDSIKDKEEKLGQQLGHTIALVNENTLNLSQKLNIELKSITESISSTLSEINKNDDEGLNQTKEQFISVIDDIRQSLLKEAKSVLDNINEQVKIMTNSRLDIYTQWSANLIDSYNEPNDLISPLLDIWVDIIQPSIDKFKEDADVILNNLLELNNEFEEKSAGELTRNVGLIRAIADTRANDLQEIISTAKEFNYSKNADTWVVVGLPTIFATLTDQLLRAKNKVVVVTPKLDLELIALSKKLRSTTRVTFVADVDTERDSKILKRVEDNINIVFRHFADGDLYACIRDSEELVFGYVREGEEIIGIRAITPSVVELIEDRLNETIIRGSKQVN
ncbi:MAG: hypothetical protein OEY49_05545 [Candidatus Heimdallarchaeota archaeon]|nr:hypothetical protein [Candidatus Heimdallarchaeota archaeon]